MYVGIGRNRHRKSHDKGTPFPALAFHLDRTAAQVENAADDVESDAVTVSRVGGVPLVELIEDMSYSILVHANARIVDFDRDRLTVCKERTGDSPTLRGKFDGVSE